MSRTFSTKNGSVDSLNVLRRWGLTPNNSNQRWTVLFERPAWRAANAPVRRVFRRFLKRDDLGNPFVVVCPGPAAAQFVVQSFGPAFHKPLSPFAHGQRRNVELFGNRPVRHSRGAADPARRVRAATLHSQCCAVALPE